MAVLVLSSYHVISRLPMKCNGTRLLQLSIWVTKRKGEGAHSSCLTVLENMVQANVMKRQLDLPSFLWQCFNTVPFYVFLLMFIDVCKVEPTAFVNFL